MAAGGIAGVVGNPAEIIMVRMQGDFAKPPEKRLNYKNCFDGLYKVRAGFLFWHILLFDWSALPYVTYSIDGSGRRRFVDGAWHGTERRSCDTDECVPTRIL